jgi:Spermine/spermidine synthase domain
MANNPRGLRVRLVALCFLMLFVELALIRWLGGNVLYLAYFSNIILLGSFLGIGLGFLWSHRSERSLLRFTPLVFGLLVLVVHNVPVNVVSTGGDLIFFGGELKPNGPPREIALPVIFLTVAALLACIGNGIAETFKKMRNLDAYQFDLIGSLIGIAVFTLLSFLGATPIVWGIITAAILLWTIRPRVPLDIALTTIPLLVLIVTLGLESRENGITWTPYYKAESIDIAGLGVEDEGVGVLVNGVPHWFQTASYDLPIYQTVYERRTDKSPVDNLLVIGAGSGNDVSVGLHEGAKHVDAVEIDRRLFEIARDGHPNRPYEDPRVDVHINDGRAYLEQSSQNWDLIILALPDSLTLVQGASSIRLESYLFTKEAADAYKEHLTNDGVFTMYNLYRESWLVDRYAATLEAAFGHAPCVTKLDDTALAVLTIGLEPDSVTCPSSDSWTRTSATPSPVHDDRPFPYLREPSIPSFYLVALGLILLASLVLVRAVGGPLGGMRNHLDLFFMGVAFLLLETKNVVQFALLFGTTWLVNSLVFGGVMLSVLLAVIVSKRVVVRRLAIPYGLLGVSIVIGWLVPQSALLPLSTPVRLILACALAFAPIFLANIIFAQRFRDSADSTNAFGANLIGAMVGGVLEYSSLVIGYRNLLIVAFLLYTAAVISGRRHLRPVV